VTTGVEDHLKFIAAALYTALEVGQRKGEWVLFREERRGEVFVESDATQCDCLMGVVLQAEPKKTVVGIFVYGARVGGEVLVDGGRNGQEEGEVPQKFWSKRYILQRWKYEDRVHR